MGLAPYGQPIYYKTILDTLVDVKNDGSFRLNQRYFDYCTGLRMTNKKFDKLFGHPPRKSEAKLNKFYMDIVIIKKNGDLESKSLDNLQNIYKKCNYRKYI